ncbi:MAG TPA: hypothetical protein DDZ89_17940 [Clostridiales bacterium]|nr:hypothetical protein [Clostridiales bacterium]
MKSKRILNILNQVNEIEEAAPGKSQVKHHHWVQWGAVAAAFILIVVILLSSKNNELPLSDASKNVHVSYIQKIPHDIEVGKLINLISIKLNDNIINAFDRAFEYHYVILRKQFFLRQPLQALPLQKLK